MAIAFDAVGAGNSSGGTTSLTFSHDGTSGATAVLWAVFANSANNGAITAKFGSTSMTQVGSSYNFATPGNGYYYFLAAFEFASIPSGSTTVTVSPTASSYIFANTVSYTGVGSVGSLSTGNGTTSTMALDGVTSASGDLVANAFVCGQFLTISSYSGTSRYNTYGSNWDAIMVIGDTAGASSVSFSADLSSANDWGAGAINLVPPASGTTVSPTTATVAITGGTPTVTIGGSVTASPTTATVAISGGTPLVISGGPFAGLLAKLANAESVNIQVFGDSLAAGFNGSENTGGWASDLGIILGTYFDVTVENRVVSAAFDSPTTLYSGSGSNTITMFNSGVDGETLAYYEDEITAGSWLPTQLGFSQPDVVIICDGYNDIGGTLAAASWVSDVETFLTSYMYTNYPGVPIIFTTEFATYNTAQSVVSTDMSAVADTLTGNNLPLTPPLQLSTNSTYPNTWVLDTQQALNGYTSAQVMSDDLPHPNATGYQIIANFMASQLASSVTLDSYTGSPTTATVHVTGDIPTVTVSSNTVAAPTTATVAITGDTSPVVVGTVAAPTTATVAITGGTPSLGGSVTASPTTATVAITGDTPTVLAPVVAAPTTATVAITGGTSAITVLDVIVPTTASMAISGGTSLITGYTYLAAPASAAVHVTGGTSVVAVASLILVTPPQRVYQVQPSGRTVQVNLHSRYVQVPPNA